MYLRLYLFVYVFACVCACISCDRPIWNKTCCSKLVVNCEPGVWLWDHLPSSIINAIYNYSNHYLYALVSFFHEGTSLEYFASVSIDSSTAVYVGIYVYACIQNLDNLMHSKYGNKQIFYLITLLFILSTFHCVDSNTVDNNAVIKIDIMCTQTLHMYMWSHIFYMCVIAHAGCVRIHIHCIYIYVRVHILYMCVCIHTVYVCIYTHIWHVHVCHKA